MSKATSESEHLKDMLVGNILAVSWPEVRKTAFLYGAIGLFHYIFRRQFLADSIGKRLAIGWSMGTIVSALGVYTSLKLDLPTGATIVCTFGVVLIIMAAMRPLFTRHAVS
jgi:zinc/manganese transport system permease protein